MSTVVVKPYVDRIDIVRGSQVIASHERSYGKGEMILDPSVGLRSEANLSR
jgi:hypothetical protein